MSSNDRIWSCAFSFDRCARITHLRNSSVKYCRFVFRIPRQSLVVVVQGLLKEKKICMSILGLLRAFTRLNNMEYDVRTKAQHKVSFHGNKWRHTRTQTCPPGLRMVTALAQQDYIRGSGNFSTSLCRWFNRRLRPKKGPQGETQTREAAQA